MTQVMFGSMQNHIPPYKQHLTIRKILLKNKSLVIELIHFPFYLEWH